MNKYVVLMVALGLLAACNKNEPIQQSYSGEVIESENQKFGIDTVASGLSNPWAIAFLPDGRGLVTERSGEIRIIKDGKLSEDRIGNVPDVYQQGQGGLLD